MPHPEGAVHPNSGLLWLWGKFGERGGRGRRPEPDRAQAPESPPGALWPTPPGSGLDAQHQAVQAAADAEGGDPLPGLDESGPAPH